MRLCFKILKIDRLAKQCVCVGGGGGEGGRAGCVCLLLLFYVLAIPWPCVDGLLT